MGVSSQSQDSNDRFRKSLELPFPLVGDDEGTIIRAYKVRWPLVGLAHRVTYVIGKDRKILKAFRSETDMKAHAAQACEFVAGRTG